MRDLMQITATCFEQVAFFFKGGDPKNQDSFVRRAQNLDSRSYNRDELRKVLLAYHQRLGSGSKTIENIELLGREGTLAIVTGQQAGFLTGPLYTLYKALTTIRLAQVQTEKLGRPVVPVFWIASEDHDWAEIAQTVFLNQEGKPVARHLPGEGGGLSIGQCPVPDWEEVYSPLAAIWPETDFRAEVFAQLKSFLERAGNLAEWFALCLQWLLKEQGLIFFDPMLAELKSLASPYYEMILKTHQDIRQALKQQTDQWVVSGYEAQIHPTGGEVNLFLAVPERRALLSSEEGFYLRGQKELLPLDDLCALLREHPERFSPNVVTRPLIQEALLPTLAYVPGPGELNYWAQLGEVFGLFNFAMPILYPRISAVVLTPAWHKALVTESLTVKEVYQGLGQIREARIKEQDSLNIEEHFAGAKSEIQSIYLKLKALEEISPNLSELFKQNEDKVISQLGYLENKVWQAQRKKCDASLRHLQQLQDGLTPYGTKQERILNPFNFVVRYGREFLNQVLVLSLNQDFGEQEIILNASKNS